MLFKRGFAVLAIALPFAVAQAQTADITGAGSTFAAPIYNKWADAYHKAGGGKVNYQGIGSAGGIKQIIAKTVDFAGSDAPMKDDELAKTGLFQFPTVVGGVVPVVNMPGVKPGQLVLSGAVLGDIYLNKIKKWNDPAIAALNSGASLPSTKITPIYRSDSSGTTDNFQTYLGAAAPGSWTKGAGKEFQGGAGEGAQKTAGVVQAIQATEGAIGYVEKGFADQSKLPVAQIDTGSGPVALTDDTAKAAIDSAKFAGEGMDLALDLKGLYATKAAGAYPLMLATYEIVCSKGYDADTSAAVKSFLNVSANQGQAGLSAAGYVPLPDAFKERLLKSVDAIA